MKKQLTKAVWLSAGIVCLVIGAIGIILPILPTTPFLLAAAGCFCKSSPKMYNWLLNNRLFGKYIKNYRDGKGVTIKTKIIALSFLWATIGFSSIFFINRLSTIYLAYTLQIIVIVVGIVVSAHILKLPTLQTVEGAAIHTIN